MFTHIVHTRRAKKRTRANVYVIHGYLLTYSTRKNTNSLSFLLSSLVHSLPLYVLIAAESIHNFYLYAYKFCCVKRKSEFSLFVSLNFSLFFCVFVRYFKIVVQQLCGSESLKILAHKTSTHKIFLS